MQKRDLVLNGIIYQELILAVGGMLWAKASINRIYRLIRGGKLIGWYWK